MTRRVKGWHWWKIILLWITALFVSTLVLAYTGDQMSVWIQRPLSWMPVFWLSIITIWKLASRHE